MSSNADCPGKRDQVEQEGTDILGCSWRRGVVPCTDPASSALPRGHPKHDAPPTEVNFEAEMLSIPQPPLTCVLWSELIAPSSLRYGVSNAGYRLSWGSSVVGPA